MWEVIKWCFLAALAFAFYQLAPEFLSSRCTSKWGNSALNVRHTPGVGCMVEIDGKWIPEANVQIHPLRRART
jgi:hypothetical protein